MHILYCDNAVYFMNIKNTSRSNGGAWQLSAFTSTTQYPGLAHSHFPKTNLYNGPSDITYSVLPQ